MKKAKAPEQPLPYSAEAERAVLGAIVLDNDAFLVAALKVQPQDFFLDQHRHVFKCMCELVDQSQPIDLHTLTEILDTRNELAAAGGVAYLCALFDGLPRATNVEHYAKIVKTKSLLRRIIHAGEIVQAMAFDEDLTESIERALQQFSDIAFEVQESGHEIPSFLDAAKQLFQRLQEGERVVMPTGLKDLDDIIGGFGPGELILVTASEVGSGKTLFSMQVRKHACENKMHSMYCSGEMDAAHLISRDIATEAEIERWKIRQPKYLDHEDLARFQDALQHQCTVCHIHDGELSLRSIRSAARRFKKKTQLDCVIVDYDELVESPGKDDLAKQVSLVRGLKALAIELKIPVVLVSQLRKALNADDAARPSLARIYGSGAKTKHASMVLFIDREYVREMAGDEAKAKIVVLKNRDGRTGFISCSFNIRTLRFENASATQLEEWSGSREDRGTAGRRRKRKDTGE